MHGSVQVSRLGQFGASGNSLIPAATLLQCYGSNVAAPYWEMLTYLLPKKFGGSYCSGPPDTSCVNSPTDGSAGPI